MEKKSTLFPVRHSQISFMRIFAHFPSSSTPYSDTHSHTQALASILSWIIYNLIEAIEANILRLTIRIEISRIHVTIHVIMIQKCKQQRKWWRENSSNLVRFLQPKLEILIFFLRSSEETEKEKVSIPFPHQFYVPCGVWNRLYADEHLSRLHQRTIVLPMGFSLFYLSSLCHCLASFIFSLPSFFSTLFFVWINKSHGEFHRSVDGRGQTQENGPPATVRAEFSRRGFRWPSERWPGRLGRAAPVWKGHFAKRLHRSSTEMGKEKVQARAGWKSEMSATNGERGCHNGSLFQLEMS